MSTKEKKTFIDLVASIASFLLRLIFPPKCVICKDLLWKESEICEECLSVWERARRVKCPVCGKTARGCTCTTFHMTDTDRLGERRISALAFYTKFGSEDVRDKATLRMVYAVKTSSDRSAVRLCARELSGQILKALILEGEKPEEWKITYPPRNQRRIGKYGFDHARDLAILLSEFTGMTFEETLENRGVKAQKSLDSLARKTNAEASYRIKRNARISGKYIIIDDVITTGATVNAVSKILKEHGAQKIYPVCIARSKKKKRKLRRPSERPWFKSK